MESEQVADIDLRRFGRVVWRWLWLIALAALIAAGAAFLASTLSTPVYEASTALLIREGQKEAGLDYNSILISERLARTYSQMLKDTPVLDETIARMGLAMTEEELAGMITVENVRDTLLINLKVRSRDPVLAAGIANTVVEVFAEQRAQIGSAAYARAMYNLDQEMQQLQTQIQACQEELDAERARSGPNSAEAARLETLVAQYRSTYADLLRSYEEMRVAEAGESEGLILTKPAKVPTVPILPRKGLNTALAGALGALVGLGVAFLIEHLDDTVKTEEDVQRATQLPTLATIPRFGRSEAASKVPLMVAHPNSAVAEAYRLLRTNTQFATLGAGERAVTIVVSSAGPREGKTTTVANLGVSLAQAGKRVLLIDTDLRRPALHTHFGLSKEVGLTSLFLQQELRPEAALQETGVKGLRLLPSGPIPANPAELLEYPQFAAILARLKESADYLILDSPPVLSVADASILGQRANGVLLVARPGKTRTDALKASVASLQRVRARVLGVVLNDAAHYPNHRYSESYTRPRRQPEVAPIVAPPQQSGEGGASAPGGEHGG